MAKYQIKYALGGGFGGVRNKEWEVIEADSYEKAQEEAYRLAREEYESYEGLYGLRDVTQIMEEDEVDQETAYDIYVDERESWLDYEVREFSET